MTSALTGLAVGRVPRGLLLRDASGRIRGAVPGRRMAGCGPLRYRAVGDGGAAVRRLRLPGFARSGGRLGSLRVHRAGDGLCRLR